MNRREVLTGMAVAGATVALSAPTIAKSVPASRAEWDAALAELKRAKAASDAFDPELTRIDEAYQTAVDQVPHVIVEIDGRKISTANEMEVSWARNGSRSLRYVEACAYSSVKASQQLVDAADARDAQLKAIDERFGWRAANSHYDALSEAICDAEQVLLQLPAPDGEALLWKVNRLYAPGEGIWEPGHEDQTHADLRRFLSNGRA